MRKGLKISLIVCGAAFAIGIVLAGIGFALGGMHSVAWIGHGFTVIDEKKLSGETESVDESFTGVSSIVIDVDAYKMVRIERGSELHVSGSNLAYFGGLKAVQEGGVLKIGPSVKQIFAGFNIGSFLNTGMTLGTLTLTLPEDLTLDEFSLTADATQIQGEGIRAEKLYINIDAADAKLSGITCDSAELDLDAGSLSLKDSELSDVKTSADAGSIRFDGCKLRSLDGSVDAGDLRLGSCECSGGGTLDISAGNVSFDGRFTGDYKISVDAGGFTMKNSIARDNASVRLDMDFGSAYIDGRKIGGSSSSLEAAKEELALFDISTSAGSVKLDFSKG